MDQDSGPSSPDTSSEINRLLLTLRTLQEQVHCIQTQVQFLQGSESSPLERLQRRVNLLAGQIDQIKSVQERLSHRIGILEEQVRVAEAHFEHQTIISARVARRVDEIEHILRLNNLQ